MKKTIAILSVITLLTIALAGCGETASEKHAPTYNGWDQYVTAPASLQSITEMPTYVRTDGGEKLMIEGTDWYPTLIDNFDTPYTGADVENEGLNPLVWTTSRHDLRWETNVASHPEYSNYWCPELVKWNSAGGVAGDGQMEVLAEYREGHVCEVCNGRGVTKGRFTGGFETRREVIESEVDNKRTYVDQMIWGQAFGYYEARVKLPKANGMWSAFWLQGSKMREIGNQGLDGTEIDIYESAFLYDNVNARRMGHAVIWNGYGSSSKGDGLIIDLDQASDKATKRTVGDLYDGEYHTFSLLWSPDCYVFYIDGIATWATNGGGISRVKEFIRFTNEIDAGDTYGPHGQVIGPFNDRADAAVFAVDYVRVFQNVNYEKYERQPSEFTSDYDTAN